MSQNSTADSYVRQISDIEIALKRLNKQTADLRKKKKEAEGHLHNWMVKHGVDEYSNIKIKKVTPKPKAKRKPAKKKKEDTIRLLADIGVNDPEELWNTIQSLQKAPVENQEGDE